MNNQILLQEDLDHFLKILDAFNERHCRITRNKKDKINYSDFEAKAKETIKAIHSLTEDKAESTIEGEVNSKEIEMLKDVIKNQAESLQEKENEIEKLSAEVIRLKEAKPKRTRRKKVEAKTETNE